MTWQVLQADARSLPLPDGSVDLIVTSPPYWGLRSYRDAGEHYDGQVGAEPTPAEYVAQLVEIIDSEWRRVLKPTGSLWLNLGDKYAGSGGGNDNTGLGFDRGDQAAESDNRGNPRRYPQSTTVGPLPDMAQGARDGHRRSRPAAVRGVRPKSLLGLPWRVALALIDRGWILRAEVIWSKPNGLPESVTDRVRRSHEQWFHLTLEGRYFSALDEIRDPYAPATLDAYNSGRGFAGTISGEHPSHTNRGQDGSHGKNADTWTGNPSGRLPGSVREVPTQPLIVSDEVQKHLGLPDHFAAFPTEWPRWIIEGWSPREICTVCGEGRRPVADIRREDRSNQARAGNLPTGEWADGTQTRDDHDLRSGPSTTREIVGYACACTPRTSHRGKRGDWKEGREPSADLTSDDFSQPGPKAPRRSPEPVAQHEWEYHLDRDPGHPTVPAVVLDPFGGTGTTAGVAHTLGRHGISVDLSMDYTRLARWRIGESGDFARVEQKSWAARQGSLL